MLHWKIGDIKISQLVELIPPPMPIIAEATAKRMKKSDCLNIFELLLFIVITNSSKQAAQNC